MASAITNIHKSANKYLNKLWGDKDYKIHQKNLKSIKSTMFSL